MSNKITDQINKLIRIAYVLDNLEEYDAADSIMECCMRLSDSNFDRILNANNKEDIPELNNIEYDIDLDKLKKYIININRTIQSQTNNKKNTIDGMINVYELITHYENNIPYKKIASDAVDKINDRIE